MRVWRAVRGEGSELRARPEPRVLPPNRLRAEDSRRTKGPPQMRVPSLAGWYLEKKVLDVWPGVRDGSSLSLDWRALLACKGSSCNLERPIGRVCTFFLRCETNVRWTEEETGKEENESLTGRFSSHCVRWETKCSLDEREKRKCSTGKVLTACAARPNARWTERGNGGKRKMRAWPGDFLTLRPLWGPNARWTKEKT